MGNRFFAWPSVPKRLLAVIQALSGHFAFKQQISILERTTRTKQVGRQLDVVNLHANIAQCTNDLLLTGVSSGSVTHPGCAAPVAVMQYRHERERTCPYASSA